MSTKMSSILRQLRDTLETLKFRFVLERNLNEVLPERPMFQVETHTTIYRTICDELFWTVFSVTFRVAKVKIKETCDNGRVRTWKRNIRLER